LADWTGLLSVAGVRFVNLQYGDCAEDLAALRAASGAEILQPPGIDLREDLDDLAALTAALDLTVAAANATGAIAGAVGAPLALLGPARSWTDLGADAYLWFPQARRLASPEPGAWQAPMAEAAALAAALPARP
ncbi:MAG: flagellar protein FlbA, partial [Phenylobacterium zucineum]